MGAYAGAEGAVRREGETEKKRVYQDEQDEGENPGDGARADHWPA